MRSHTAAAVVLVREADLPHVPRALDGIRAQEGIDVEAILVDQTLAGELEGRDLAGARVVRERSPSRGLGLVRGMEATDADAILVWEARSVGDPSRAARQLAALDADPATHLSTCDLALAHDELDDAGQPYTTTRALDLAGDDLPGLWNATLCVRRALLSTIDRAAFAPSELGLLLAAVGSGVRAHVSEPLVRVDAADSAALDDDVRLDGDLLRLAHRPPLERPEITVLLATHDRCDVLLECVASFARQRLRPGSLEIVVVDDASSDATPRVMPHVATNTPLVFDRNPIPGGASGARNIGLPKARGRFVLFVNDDTIAPPDFVRAHLEAHRELGENTMVQGLFRQPERILANALNRVLDEGELVFGYSAWTSGQELLGAQLYTCNVSVATDAVRAIGGFDASYSTYGCEDTDIGERLVASGQRLVYRPECAATHLHELSFDDFRRRQVTVARAYVRLYQDHPVLLEGTTTAEHSIASLRQNLTASADQVPQVERTARALSSIDLDAAARGSADGPRVVAEITASLSECLRFLHPVYWTRGLVEGLEAFGFQSFAALLESARARATVTAFESHDGGPNGERPHEDQNRGAVDARAAFATNDSNEVAL